MKKINYSEVYLLDKPKKLLMSILVVDGQLPLSPELHETVLNLSEMSDVFFIFPNAHNPSLRKVDLWKFSNLYQAYGFLQVDDKNVGEGVMKSLYYDRQVFEKSHLGYAVGILDITLTTTNLFSNLVEINNSSIVKPILEIERMSSSEYFGIYQQEEQCFEDNLFNRILDKFLKEEVVQDKVNSYCRYFSKSPLIYLSSIVANNLLIEYGEESFKEYVKSFEKRVDPRYLISSLIKLKFIDYIDRDISKLDVKNLNKLC